ncbi:hypothetical protein GQ600_20344 [Phytophthora cactorum]|nr:hypothetical protein GQ600_20344 [Phytophthora cactorum]
MMKVHVYMYEALIDDEYHEEMETVWKGMLKKRRCRRKSRKRRTPWFRRAVVSGFNTNKQACY